MRRAAPTYYRRIYVVWSLIATGTTNMDFTSGAYSRVVSRRGEHPASITMTRASYPFQVFHSRLGGRT